MPLISVVINVDTRPVRTEQTGMFSGVVSRDFLTDGIYNKIKFFQGFDKEVIVFVDEHEPLDEVTEKYLRSIVDTLVIRKHNKKFEDREDFAAFNDFNYISALAQARGKYVFHFDGDIAAFTPSQEPIQEMLLMLEHFDYVSYPSYWSPNPVHDESFDHWWVSTRFFCCKRSTLDFTEIIKCQLDYDYMFSKYPAKRACHWLEHALGLIAKYKGRGVFYPKIEIDKWLLFCWENYDSYALRRLNEQSYEEVREWVLKMGGLFYPNNLRMIAK
jgi:hypothetical protein